MSGGEMRYVSDLSAREFWAYIKTGMTAGWILAAVYVVILAMIIFPLTGQQTKDRRHERNLYFALAGQDVADPRAKDTAAYVKLMYGKGIRNFKTFESSIDFKAYAPNSLKFARDHKDRVEDIIENPEKAEWYAATYAAAPSWWSRENLYVFLSLSGGWFLLALCVSIGYIRYALENFVTHGLWWQYPWKRCFAYFWLPLTIPYILCVQTGVLLLFIARQILGADRRVEVGQSVQQSAEEKETAARQAFEGLVMQARNAISASYTNWVEITREALKSARNAIEAEERAIREKLVELAHAIEEKQRNLAQSRALAKRLEEAILEREGKSLAEIDREFEALLHKEGVRAFRVSFDKVEIFTETIFITLGEERFEIGDFHIIIEISGKGKIIVRNLRNTREGGRDHPFGIDGGFCFGVNATDVLDALTRRDFLPLVTFILEALRSSNRLSGRDLEQWRLVKEGGI